MLKRFMRKLGSLLVVSLLLFGAVPCQAMIAAPPHMVASMRELLAWYGGLTGTAPRECGVTAPVVLAGEVILGATPCRVDIVFLHGLCIPAGARLTVDNPNLVLMCPPTGITVEPGGELHVRRWNALTAVAMPQGGIVVQAGGTLLMESGVTLPDGVVIDHNPPPNILPPIPPNEPETPNPPVPEAPDSVPPDADETPPVEESLSIKGEVLKVSANGALFAMLTLPRVDPARTETVVIERSADAREWNTEYIFRWDKDARGFLSDDTPEFGRMSSRTRYDDSKTDFWYLARLSDKPFYLRVLLTGADGQQAVSDAIKLTEPPVGQYPGDDDHEDSGGNRGGGGQGTTDREEQKKTAAPASGENPETAHEMKTQTSAAPSGEASLPPAPQIEAPPPQAAAEQPPDFVAAAAHPAQGSLSEEKPPKQAPNSTARNWIAAAATLALCGGIWIFTIKRKKS